MNNVIDIYDTCNTIDIYNQEKNDSDNDIQCMYINFVDGKVSCKLNDVLCEPDIDYCDHNIRRIPLDCMITEKNFPTCCYIKINIYDVVCASSPSLIINNCRVYKIFNGCEIYGKIYVDQRDNRVMLCVDPKNNGCMQILCCDINEYDYIEISNDFANTRVYYYYYVEHVLHLFNLDIFSKCFAVPKNCQFSEMCSINVNYDAPYTKNELSKIKNIQIPFVHKNKSGKIYLECYDHMMFPKEYYYYIVEKITYDDVIIDFIQTEKCKCKIFKIQHVNNNDMFEKRSLRCMCFNKKILKKMKSVGLYRQSIRIN